MKLETKVSGKQNETTQKLYSTVYITETEINFKACKAKWYNTIQYKMYLSHFTSQTIV